MATLATHGVVVDAEEDWEDWVTPELRKAGGAAIIGHQPHFPVLG
jgi:hypothetical protein